MALTDNFGAVKEAIKLSPTTILPQLGVDLSGKSSKGWMQGNCVLCSDKSGSASYSQQGYLVCHQCGEKKKDVFAWYAEIAGLASAWDACKAIAKVVGVDIQTGDKQRKNAAPRQMTENTLRTAVTNLLESDQAANARKFLAERDLLDPEFLEKAGIGFMNNQIIFSQRGEDGVLKSWYRTYSPRGAVPWRWSKGGTVGWWGPICVSDVPPGATIIVLEGEFDVATAWSVLRLQEKGIYAFSWTGGAGSHIAGHQIPAAWRKHKFLICYDNDVWQGPDFEEYRAPNRKKLKEMERRRSALLDGLVSSIVANKGSSKLLQIPIDPLETWGGDFRDWVNNGGSDIYSLPTTDGNDLAISAGKAKEIPFEEVFEHLGKRVIITASIASISEVGNMIWPTLSAVNCPKGTLTICRNCPVPTLHDKMMVDFSRWQPQLAEYLAGKGGPGKDIEKTVIGPPRGCGQASFDHIDYDSCNRWEARTGEPESECRAEITVVSKEAPPLTGVVEVYGRVYQSAKGMMLLADKLVQPEQKIDIEPHLVDLKRLTVGETDSLEVLDSFFANRAADFASNVTTIYGRADLHTMYDLLAHSVIEIAPKGSPIRGWLDACCVGPTRTGKSFTFKKLMEFTGLGTWRVSMENSSRAGLTMGTTFSNGTAKITPGLFPRNHRGMVALDEFHIMTKRFGENPTSFLQSARDEGVVYSDKAGGSVSLPAKCRFLTVGNWVNSKKDTFRFMCEHFRALYGTPESLSRMDFGVVVPERPSETELVPVPQEWTAELTRVMIARSWAMKANKVFFDPEVIEWAEQICDDWKEIYASEDCPLFTPEEKVLTLWRIATAVACVTLSLKDHDIDTCHVRLVHVKWAARWLVKTWELSEYDQLAKMESRKAEVIDPFEAEWLLTKKLNITKADEVMLVLPAYFGYHTMVDILALTGLGMEKAAGWSGFMVRANMFRQVKQDKQQLMSLSKGGVRLLRNLIAMAEEYPQGLEKRMEKIIEVHGGSGSKLSMLPMDSPIDALRAQWRDQCGSVQGNLLDDAPPF